MEATHPHQSASNWSLLVVWEGLSHPRCEREIQVHADTLKHVAIESEDRMLVFLHSQSNAWSSPSLSSHPPPCLSLLGMGS